ncbi:hypothetical protein Tco_1143518 [Tanacetum coccineum]
MRTRSQSREQRPPPEEPPVIIEPLRIEYPFQEDPHVEPMADTRTMAQLLQAPTEGTNSSSVMRKKKDPHAHIRYFTRSPHTEGPQGKYETLHQAVSSDVAELKDIVRALLLDKKNQASASAPAPAPVKAVELSCVTAVVAISQNCPALWQRLYVDKHF